MSQALKTPAGQTVVQVSERYDSGTITVSAPNTAETSLVVLNTGVWREGALLIKATTLSATTPQLVVNLWALDNSGNRYPLPGAAQRTTDSSPKPTLQLAPPETTSQLPLELRLRSRTTPAPAAVQPALFSL